MTESLGQDFHLDLINEVVEVHVLLDTDGYKYVYPVYIPIEIWSED